MHKIFARWSDDLIPIHIDNELNARGKKKVLPSAWKNGETYSSLNKNSVGLRTGQKTVNVIDIDTKDLSQLTEPFKTWVEDRLMFEDCLTVESKNGYHFYFYCDFKVRTTSKKDGEGDAIPFIDFRGEGGLIFVHSNSLVASYDVICDEEPINDISEIEKLIPEYHEKVTAHADVIGFANLDDESDTSLLKAGDSKTFEELTEIINKTDPSVPRNEWLALMASAYNMIDTKPERLEKVLKEWSSKGENYDEEGFNIAWKEIVSGNFGKDFKGGTLILEAKHQETKQTISTIRDAISVSSSIGDLERAVKDLSKTELKLKDKDDATCRNELLNELTEKSKELIGKPEKVKWKKLIALEEKSIGTPDNKIPDWLKDIVYVDSYSGNKFYIISTAERLSADGVGGRYAKQLNELKLEWKLKSLTINQLIKFGYVTVCSKHEYNPTSKDTVFKNDLGGITLNLYRADSTPKPAEQYSEKGKELVEKFIEHVHLLMSKGEADILLDWLAYTAQNFGKKVLWTPLIQSAEGLGKSIIGNVMINHVFGKANSGTVDSNVVVSPQTSWATHGVFKVLEEIKLAGHNRYEVLNQLKPFITNDTVSRVEKYESSVEVRNFTNFIAFTNFKDAIPVTADDRRWWVVFSKQNSINELEFETKQNRFDYFKPLHDLARPDSKYGCEFLKYLLERNIENFNPNFPPESIHKDRMRATEDSKVSYLTELETVIENTYKGVTPDVLSTAQLKLAIQNSDFEGGSISSLELPALLRRLNFTKFPKKIKADGFVHNVWFKKAGLSDNDVRELFHESMKLDENDMFDDLDVEEL